MCYDTKALRRRVLRTLLPAVAASAAALIFCGVAAAHPHVWITVETEILYNADKAITGFRHKWSFDEMYAALATQALDQDGDGEYSAGELQPLLDINISSLKEFEYFTFPMISKKVVGRGEPKDYRIEYKDAVLSLYMTIPLKQPVPLSKTAEFSLIISDPSFYVDFAFAGKDAVRLSSGPAGCRPAISDPRPGDEETARLQSLGDSYFADPDVAAKIAAEYAKTVTITCSKPAS